MLGSDVDADAVLALSREVEFWRNEAARWERTALQYEDELVSLKAPAYMPFRGKRGDVYWERDCRKMTVQEWAAQIKARPHLQTWSTATQGDMVYAMSPRDIKTRLRPRSSST